MTAHLLLLCHASTTATRAASFPDDEPVDPYGLRDIANLRGHLRHVDRCIVSPAARARQTAAGLGLDARIEPALADCDFGRWRGKTLEHVQSCEPQALAEWMQEPGSSPHGGESTLALMQRVQPWLQLQRSSSGVTLAITHAPVIRAAIVLAIEAEARSFWRIDIAPLSLSRLSSRGSRWNLTLVGSSAAEAAHAGTISR
jgi:broad specificity phosphatase PhoE